ncbi:MAG: hypothetical protein E7680_06200 [Ruminococcaceae bacterium]|nr:hypothetical protein [Oscillospiraceae bacterium]
MKRNRLIYIPGRSALLFLRLALPLVVLEGIAILISYLIDRQKDILLAFDTWSGAIYDYLAAILVAVLLAIVADAVEMEQKKRNKD